MVKQDSVEVHQGPLVMRQSFLIVTLGILTATLGILMAVHSSGYFCGQSGHLGNHYQGYRISLSHKMSVGKDIGKVYELFFIKKGFGENLDMRWIFSKLL